MKYETRYIDLTLLIVNTENPRFDMVGNQREAISQMIENQKEKLVRLSQDIIENGVNPSDLVIVTPHQKFEDKFNVMEGNRRVTALKLLNNPGLIPEKNKSLLNKFKELSKVYKTKPLRELNCVIFKDEKEALKWIKLKHTGENEGIGVVGWDAQQKARFEERFEGKSQYSLQVIDFLRKSDEFSKELKPELSKVPISSLQRLVSDPDIRAVIGLETDDGKIISYLSPEELTKPLTKIVKDLIKDKFTVKDIYYKDDRANYIETFKDSELPDKTSRTSKWEIITSTPPASPKPEETSRQKSKHLSTVRNTIIPKSCVIHINQNRINKIYRELKDIDLRYYINAAAITFRVFVELSVDSFIQEKKLKTNIDAKLVKKVQTVTDFLDKNSYLTKQQLKPINTMVSSPNSLFSINTFNAYVHNKYFNPIANELKITWDNIEPFIKKIWELI
jgi:hypothetical protein